MISLAMTPHLMINKKTNKTTYTNGKLCKEKKQKKQQQPRIKQLLFFFYVWNHSIRFKFSFVLLFAKFKNHLRTLWWLLHFSMVGYRVHINTARNRFSSSEAAGGPIIYFSVVFFRTEYVSAFKLCRSCSWMTINHSGLRRVKQNCVTCCSCLGPQAAWKEHLWLFISFSDEVVWTIWA